MTPYILVVGDVVEDIDDFFVQTKERDGYPVLERRAKEWRYGCAAAVGTMARELGAQSRVQADFQSVSQKRRLLVGDKVICRLDHDREGNYQHLHYGIPPSLILIADYAKGYVTQEAMAFIGCEYRNTEIIADFHPSRSLDFYHCAAALKASWDAPHDNRPFIRTMGKDGMLLRVDGNEFHFPAKNLEPLDPCGAGDMVLATLGVGRLNGLSWYDCCEWASENAAEVCRHWGSVAVESRQLA